jgi:SAM-dependent methyltransferase
MAGAEMVFGPLAEDYARYRPGYPADVVGELERACGLESGWTIADIGSGTGNLARLFLDNGNEVIGVEPNREMRVAGERLLADYPNFRSLDGSAEHIPLDNQIVDLITVGQALHWFDLDLAREEFRRILRPGGWVAVTWNDRQSNTTAFTRDYVELTHSLASVYPPPCPPPSLGAEASLERLFGSANVHSAQFPHSQHFDITGLLGRARSSGYLPQPNAPEYGEFAALMTDLFARHARQGVVEFHYIAQLHYGQL